MERLFLLDNVKCLTTKGLKFTHELTNDDTLLITTDNGELIEWSDFTIHRDEFSSGYYNTDSEYSGIITHKKLSAINNCSEVIHYINGMQEIHSSIFNLGNKLYGGVPVDVSLLLSTVISNYFTVAPGEDCLIPKTSASNKFLFNTFSQFHKFHRIYFPYDRLSKCYRFKTTLYKDSSKLSQLLLDNRDYFANVADLLYSHKVSSGYTYRAIWLDTYEIACIFQVLLSLCDYRTKLRFDTTRSKFKVTYVSANHADYKKELKNKSVFFLDTPRTFTNITLNGICGNLILSHNNDENTSVSILETNYNLNL